MGVLMCPVLSCPFWKRNACTNTTEHVRIHRFPVNNTRIREAWESFVSEANGYPFQSTNSHGLCSSHFPGKNVMPTGRVTRNAVPSIAPLTTKKVLCKWDVAASRLVPLEIKDEKSEIQTPKGFHPAVIERAPLEELDEMNSQDIEELDNCDSTLDAIVERERAVSSSEEYSSAEFLSQEQLAFLDIEAKQVPKRPQSLNTAKEIEQAIRREKRLAFLRYKASMRKIRGLEVLLKRVTNSSDVESQDISPPTLESALIEQPLCPVSPVRIVTPEIPTTLKTVQLSWHRPEITNDCNLPPPLFDDYN